MLALPCRNFLQIDFQTPIDAITAMTNEEMGADYHHTDNTEKMTLNKKHTCRAHC